MLKLYSTPPQVTLEWLRRCLRETPSLRMQVSCRAWCLAQSPPSALQHRSQLLCCGQNQTASEDCMPRAAALLPCHACCAVLRCAAPQVLVTGSLYLVGDVLKMLGRSC